MKNFVVFTILYAVFSFVFAAGCAEPMPIRAHYLPVQEEPAEHELSEEEPASSRSEPGTVFYAPADGLDFISPPALLDFEEIAEEFDVILSKSPSFHSQPDPKNSPIQFASFPLDSVEPAEQAEQEDLAEQQDDVRSKPVKSSSRSSAAQLSGVININTAPAETLILLPGVGPALAARIIEYREKRKFTQPTHLRRVKGIGPAKFKKIKDYIVVSGETTLSRA